MPATQEWLALLFTAAAKGGKNVKKNVYVIGHSALGLFRTNANKQLKIPTGGRQISWLFTNVVEKMNSGLSRTTSASGQKSF